ncbi:nitrate- and nitrite sensing domain-containing protein [Actinoallomurus sp. CA-150999]|uniref:nitrate- and nitrite sensing domain-containing protein n=1 Tax=Actinoallomurus sp. CA-150999 TaxID=3239887 RepID=UPI003D8C6757
MRTRRRSIRFAILGLLVVPLASLTALWGFAAQNTADDAIEKRNLDTINRRYGGAVQPLSVDLAQERLQAVVWLSGGRKASRDALDEQRGRTDASVARFVRTTGSGSFRRTLTAQMKQRLAALVDKIGELQTIRSGIDSGAMDRLAALNAYDAVYDAQFELSYLVIAVSDPTIYRQAYQVIELSRAQELAARELTLVTGVLLAGGRMSRAEHGVFATMVIEQRYLEKDGLAQFVPEIGTPFRRLLDSAAYTDFKSLEDRILVSPGGKRPLKIDSVAWRSAADTFIGGMNEAIDQARPVVARKSKGLGDSLIRRLALVGGAGLAAVLLSAFLMLRFGRRMTRELVGLQKAVSDLADRRLPDIVGRLRRGDDVNVADEAPPLDIGRTAEVANVAEAFSTTQRTAIEAAVGQATLRKAVNKVFLNLARRNQALLHRQLAMLDALERKAADPDSLEELFRLDHLTTRMRRHAEGLIILSGGTPGRGWRHPVTVLDVLRGAIGEIEDYTRVEVVTLSGESIGGTAVADVIHLVAELVENAVSFSPPTAPVEVGAGLAGNGFVIEVVDRGLGMNADKLAAINERLANPPEPGVADGDQLGLFVVGILATRHGIKVSLAPNPYGGLTAIALLPHGLVVAEHEASAHDMVNDHGGDQAADDLERHGGKKIASAATVLGDSVVRPLEDRYDPLEQTGPRRGGSRRRLRRVEPLGADTPAEPVGADARAELPAGDRPLELPAGDVPVELPAGDTPVEPLAGGTPAGFHEPTHSPAPGPVLPETGRGGAVNAEHVGVPTAGTHAGMPRRVRQASLPPELRGPAPTASRAASETIRPASETIRPASETVRPAADDGRADSRIRPASGGGPDSGAGRSPERARSIMSSMQNGWRRGRAEDPAKDTSDGGTPAPGDHEGE